MAHLNGVEILLNSPRQIPRTFSDVCISSSSSSSSEVQYLGFDQDSGSPRGPSPLKEPSIYLQPLGFRLIQW